MLSIRLLGVLLLLLFNTVGTIAEDQHGDHKRVLDLRVANKRIAPDGFEKAAVLVGRSEDTLTFPGPLIQATKGDRLRINVTDNLTNSSMNRVTTIHWHGIFQRHTNFADGVAQVTQCPIVPGESFLYDFYVPDPGTYWYHSHVSVQYCDGLRGPLIVYDPEDPYKHLYDIDDESTIITISDWYHLTAQQVLDTLLPALSNATLINGKGRYPENPTAPLSIINVQPNKRYRFRLISMSCDPFHTFSIDNHNFTIIEADGQYTEPLTVTTIPLFAAQRYSIILHTNQPVSNYWIRASPDTGAPGVVGYANNINSAILRYAGAPDKEPSTTERPPANQIVLSEPNLHYHKTDLDVVDYELGPPDKVIPITMGFQPPATFLMNGVQYKPPITPVLTQILSGARRAQDLLPPGLVYTVPKNKTIEVRIYGGDAPSGPHPMHLHGHAFSVVKSYNSDVYNFKNPVRRDVTSVSNGTLSVFRFRTDNPGPWFFHCHKDYHLADGLAIVFAEDTEDTPAADPVPTDWKELCPTFEAYNATNSESL